MSCAVRYILCSFAVLFLTLDSYCQDEISTLKVSDAMLDRYELMCGKCLSMKDVVLTGGKVSRNEASGLINEFLSLNRELKMGVGALSGKQKVRFERINRWFATGCVRQRWMIV